MVILKINKLPTFFEVTQVYQYLKLVVKWSDRYILPTQIYRVELHGTKSVNCDNKYTKFNHSSMTIFIIVYGLQKNIHASY